MTSTVPVPRAVVDVLLRNQRWRAGLSQTVEGDRAAWEDLARAAATPVPWERATGLLRDLRARILIDAPTVSGADQLQAYVTGRLADLDVDVTDERVLYEALAVISIVSGVADTARANGQISGDANATISGICRAVAAGLAILAPTDAQ